MEFEYPEIDKLAESVNELRNSGGRVVEEYFNRYEKTFAIRFVNEATALEGNSLTLEETRYVLKGKELEPEATKERKREIQEIRNYFKAYQYTRKTVKKGQELSDRIVRNLHEIVTERIHHGGVYRCVPVWVPNNKTEFPAHYDLKILMGNFLQRLAERVMVCRLPEAFHPIDLAAWAYGELIRLHPFLEGNDRVGALLMNYLLIEHGLFPVSIPRNRQEEYLDIMNRYRWEREIVPLACLIEELEKKELLALEQGAKKVV